MPHYSLPDPKIPFASADERTQVMLERDPMGRKRYDSDPAFRACCEAKMAIDLVFDDGSSVRSGHGVQRFTGHDGQVTPDESKGLQFRAAEGEIELTGKIQELKKRVVYAEEAADRAKIFADARIKIQKTIEVKPKDQIEGFSSQDELIAAMASPEYRNDSTVRAYIEARVGATKPFTE